jgi:hypothetical protein
MERREFLRTMTGGLLAAPLAASAQQAAKVARIGFLATNLAAAPRERPSVKDWVSSVTSKAAPS